MLFRRDKAGQSGISWDGFLLNARQPPSNVVIGQFLSRALLIQPSLSGGLGKNLNFENPYVNWAPVRPIESLRKIAPAERALPKKDCLAFLFELTRSSL